MPPQTITLGAYNPIFEEQWNHRPGVPMAVYNEAGPGYLGCKKYMRAGLAGREDHRTPVATSLPGAGAATVAQSVDNASGMGTDLFRVQRFNTIYQTLEYDWSIARRQGKPLTYFPKHVSWQMNGHAKRVEHLMSAYYYGNGGGALARVDPDSTINIGDTTIQLLLPRTAIQFEPQRADPETGLTSSGDVITFSVDDGLGGAGPKNYTPIITGAANVAGILTLNPGIPADPIIPANPLVQPGDYIFISGTYNQVFQGLAAWNPADVNDLTATFNGVNRLAAPERLGGLRVRIPRGQDPRTKWRRICKVAAENNSRFTVVYTTTEEYEQISNAVDTGVMKGERYTPAGYDAGKMGPGRPRAKTLKRKGGVVMWVDIPSMMIENPVTGLMIKIIADPYFYDVNEGPEGQALYRMMDHDRFYMESVKDESYWWVNRDGNGPLYQLQRTSIISAVYEVYGQFICESPLHLGVASPNVIV